MKKYLLITTFFVTTVGKAFCQSDSIAVIKYQPECEADAYAIETPLLSKNFYGMDWNLKYFPIKHLGTGVHLSISEKKIKDTFNYAIKKPIILYYEIGWTNQYNFIQTRKLRMNITMANCLVAASLCDDAIRRGKYPKEIATNYFYSLEPGAGISFNLSSGKKNPSCWLSAEYDYRFVIGGTKYASPNRFPGNLFKIGLSIIGPS
jgi:hypothetical protein